MEEDVKGEKDSVLDDLSIGCFWDGDFHSSANYCLQIRDETGRGINPDKDSWLVFFRDRV